MTNTNQRILSAIFMMLILIGFTMVGSQGILILLLIVGVLLIDEIVFHLLKIPRTHFGYYTSVISYIAGFYFHNYTTEGKVLVDPILNTAVLINISLLIYLFLEKMEQKSFMNLLTKFSFLTGFFVFIPMMSLCYVINDSRWLILTILLVAFNISVDTGAWFFGKKFGKKKLWPSISPKKTINGAIGGSILSVIMASVISFFALGKLNIGIIFAFLILSCFAQLGDLIESKLKRQAGIKDSSNLIPGHGGIYDRVDSLIFVAPFYVVVLKLFY